jgi:hypothetical protein
MDHAGTKVTHIMVELVSYDRLHHRKVSAMMIALGKRFTAVHVLTCLS